MQTSYWRFDDDIIANRKFVFGEVAKFIFNDVIFAIGGAGKVVVFDIDILRPDFGFRGKIETGHTGHYQEHIDLQFSAFDIPEIDSEQYP